MKHSAVACAASLMLAVAAAPVPALAQGAGACERACLNRFTDRYLEALAANDPSRLALAPDFKLTENTAILKPGDGLWRTATGLGKFRLEFADPGSGQAGAIAVVLENGVEQLLGLRLKIANDQYKQAEMVVARKGEGQRLVTSTLVKPLPEFLQAVPVARRSSRAELIEIANKYFTAIEKNDGSIVPFADDGFRIENGIRTCNDSTQRESTGGVSSQFSKLRSMHCADQLSTGLFTYIQSIEPRRIDVTDVERGLVLAIVRFNHPGRPTKVNVPGFGAVDYMKNMWARNPTSAFIYELFKVEDHKIQRVMAVITKGPYRGATGWE